MNLILFQKLFVISLLIGVFIFVVKNVEPDDFGGLIKVALFSCAGFVAVFFLLHLLYGYSPTDFSSKLAFLENTRLFSDSVSGKKKNAGGHYILQRKNSGYSDELVGDVLITFVMVDDPESAWSDEELSLFQSQIPAEAQFLEHEAARYDVDLDIRVQYIQCSVNKALKRGDEEAWRNAALKAAGLPRAGKVSKHLKKTFGADQAPVFFCVSRDGRSYASHSRGRIPFEYGIIYREAGACAHELCHQFGAMDYYYPEEIKQLAQKIFPNSIMLTSVDRQVDELSAYVMGWTDSPSPDAQRFIEQTKWVDADTVAEALTENTFTGVGTVENENYIFTGDIVAGIPDGMGTFNYKNGNSYTGSVSYGHPEGQGTYTWANGTWYSGTWTDGKITGYGTMSYEDGTIYEGDFVNAVAHGWGSVDMPNGNNYTGEFFNGNFHGQGTLTYASGYQQSGKWNQNVFIGG